MLIKISMFKGKVPKIPPRSLPSEYAQSATNADLSQGLLKGLYKPSATITLNNTMWRSIFPVKSGGATFWALSQQEAHFINAPVYDSAGRFYYTDGVRGRESNYTMASNAGANTYGDPNTSYYLGVPKPATTLTATLRGTSDTIVVDSVAYVYTFVTSWGYEGEPSDPTAVIDIDGGEYVELGNFEIPVPTGYNIVGIRIYRTSTASDDKGVWLFVKDIMTGVSADHITPAEITANGGIWNDSAGVAAQGTITMSGVAVADETFVIDTQTFTWKASRAATGEVKIGANAVEAVTNIVVAVTADLDIVKSVDGAGNTVVVTATAVGTGGNNIVFTEASTNMAVDGTGKLGATTAGSDGVLTPAANLGEAIQCADYIEPPSALSGLIALPNGVVAAYREKEVYISEPYIHYGFPDDYITRANDDIKSIGHYGHTIVAGTEGRPYKINGYDPQALSIDRLPDKQSCLFTRAMVSGNAFVLYPCPDGLYKISEDGNGLVTDGIFVKEQWKTLLTNSVAYDKTIIAFLYDGKYYAFFEGTNTGFIVSFDSEFQHYAEFTLDATYSIYGGYHDEIDDTLYLLVLIGSTYYIKKWEGATAHFVAKWKSKIFVTHSTFFSCAKVNGAFVADSTGTGTISSSGTAVTGAGTAFDTELEVGNMLYNASLKEYREVETITDATHLVLVSAFTSNLSGAAFKYNSAGINIYKDGVLHFTRALNTTSPFRLPSGVGREWSIEVKSNREVYEIKVAQAMSELAE